MPENAPDMEAVEKKAVTLTDQRHHQSVSTRDDHIDIPPL